jgi:hypothetical protein
MVCLTFFFLLGGSTISNMSINQCTTGISVEGEGNVIESIDISTDIIGQLTIGVLLEASALNTIISGKRG